MIVITVMSYDERNLVSKSGIKLKAFVKKATYYFSSINDNALAYSENVSNHGDFNKQFCSQSNLLPKIFNCDKFCDKPYNCCLWRAA